MNIGICECCFSNNITIIGNHLGYDHLKCNNCKYECFINRESSINNLMYEKDSDYNDDMLVSRTFSDLLQYQHITALKYIVKNFKNKSVSILDVGCFNGFFVKKLLEMGYDAYGIDFNKKAIDYGINQYHLTNRISVANIETLIQSNKKYDMVTLFEVIEHMENPRELLMKFLKLLNDKGILILSAPNNKMMWRPALDYPPHHLSRFYPESIKKLITSVGFSKVQVIEQMNLYNLMRNYFGNLFRNKNKQSMRGGQLIDSGAIHLARKILNKTRKIFYALFYPLDKVLYLMGLRYISQVVIAQWK